MLDLVNDDSPAFPGLETAPTLHEQVQGAIREMIISGQLKPGAPLTPASLAVAMNTSATPVREALRVLQQEGLVEVADRRFTRVARPRLSVAQEAYPLISLLEANHIRSRGAVGEDLLEKAEEANRAQMEAENVSQRLHAAIRFHRLLCADAGPITSGFLEALYAKVALLEVSYHAKLFSHDEASTREHDEIVREIRAGRPEEAARLLQLHWERGCREVVALFESDGQGAGAEPMPYLDFAASPGRSSRKRA